MRNQWQNLLAAAGILVLTSVEVDAQTLKGAMGDVAEQSNQSSVVFGEAETAAGGVNVDVIKQNAGVDNPLGNPIVNEDEPVAPIEPISPIVDNQNAAPAGIVPISQSNPQGVLKSWEEPLPQPSNQIESEIYQSGNDIIDEQAYPIKDVSTVTEPNLQPVIVTQ